jgi:hypothetical protein
MNNILNEIKWAWQRVFRGYDDTIYWGFDGYLEQIIPALKEFCKKETIDDRRITIYSKMQKLINDWEDKNNGFDDWFEYPNSSSKMWKYFGENIGWFWD